MKTLWNGILVCMLFAFIGCKPAMKQTFTVNGVSFDMIRVEGGTFSMGKSFTQPTDTTTTQSPDNQVTLNSYYIGETEVTQELWSAVMYSNPSLFKGLQNPVEQVSWDYVQVFISQLNQLTGKCFRLPTEAEWEFAARGGVKHQGYKLAGSNMPDTVAWFNETSNFTPHPVAQKLPNELGLYDMNGNVWEWCMDCNRTFNTGSKLYFANGQYDDEKQPGDFRALRGGSWFFVSRGISVNASMSRIPSYSRFDVGFRLVLLP